MTAGRLDPQLPSTCGFDPGCEHNPDEHDEDEGCLNGWTATEKGCPCRPKQKPAEPVGVLDLIAVRMAASGATGFRRISGNHDGRWRRNR